MSSGYDRNGLKCLNVALPDEWEAKLVPDEGRLYYVNHKNQTSSWLPPRENWDPGNSGLPYGWEAALDKNRKAYYIKIVADTLIYGTPEANRVDPDETAPTGAVSSGSTLFANTSNHVTMSHVDNYTTRDDPRDDPDYVEPPKPREVELQRDPQKGFGFVAGSEKPVVVRFVTEGGPSVDKLMPGDQLIKINGQDVKKAPREFVIDLVRSCKQTITLTVCQPYTDNSARKSALLTAAKKDRLKKNPSRVRFAEEIIVNGASVPTNSPEESYVPFMPNVLKVFLENGQTKSFKYDSKTTVKDVVNSLQEKLNIKSVQNFNLVLHNMKSHMPGRMTLLQDNETVSEIASRPGARHFRCMFRVAYVPKDSYDLLKQDPIAFEYFYMQCVNDVLHDRFNNELKPDTILRLSALHIQQHAMSNNMTGKINIKNVEKEFGFEKFVPQSVRESMRVKDLRKVLAQSLKMNQNLTAPGQKQLTALQAKLHYMKIVSELKTFGSRVFMVTLLDKKTEAMVLVGPKAGISLVTNVRFYTLSMLADFCEVETIKLAKEKDNMMRVELAVKGDEPGTLNLGLLKEDAMNFVCMVDGYYKIFVDSNRSLVQKNAGRQTDDPEVPAFESKHTVIAAPWSYPEDIVSMVIEEDDDDMGNQGNGGSAEFERAVDLSCGPPAYEGSTEFISKLKQDLGIKSEIEETVPNSTEKEEKVGVPRGGPNKVPAPVKATPPKDNQPMKTVITIENRGRQSANERASVIDNKKDESESSTNSAQSSVTKAADQNEQAPAQQKRRRRSPTPDARKFRKQNPEFDDDDDETFDNDVEYVNSTKNRLQDAEHIAIDKKFVSESDKKEYMNLQTFKRDEKKVENGENSSDTDSGVGADADKPGEVIKDVRQKKKSDGEGDDIVDPDMQYESGRSDLPLQTELHLDLSSFIDPAYRMISSDQGSPGSNNSPDLEAASFVGPFDEDMLPQEVASAAYDPRMFHNHEIYIDPDIIDLTLLPPYPPTAEELEELQNTTPPIRPLPPSPRLNKAHQGARHQQHPHHPPLLKTATSITEYTPQHHEAEKPHLQKSASVGYCPDFLDEDIDAFIDKLTIQPPPSDTAPDSSSQDEEVDWELAQTGSTENDNLAQSWNGPATDNSSDRGLEFDNEAMSKTIELGSLALDDPLSSLVIPPPPDESSSIGDILIVPPVESVKERRKKFEKLEAGSKMENSKPPLQNGNGNDKQKVTDDKKVSDSGENKTANKPTNAKETDSPASVSEKLNELLKSLTSYDEPVGQFRRTSSLRLSRASSLDFLNVPKKVDPKTEDLVLGSVRLKPRVRPGLNLDRPHVLSNNNGTVHVPLKVSSTEKVNADQKPPVAEKPVINSSKSGSVFQRTQSCEVLLPDKQQQGSTEEDENQVSESFASLKAKLASYRDSLLNRSLRRKNKKQEADRASLDGDSEPKKSPLTRSNSFSQLFRRSLRKSERGNSTTERSSSESREATSTESRETADGEEGKEGNKEIGGTLSSRDRKIWNTLTATSRATFRPNTATSQVQEYFQERLAPQTPIPMTPPVERGETRKPKAGPMKALSTMFDEKPTQDEEQKSQKTGSGVKPSNKSSKRPAPAIPKPATSSSSSVQTSVSSSTPTSSSTSVKISSATSTVLTKPLSLPMAPPRRKHNSRTLNEDGGVGSSEQKSKDDSDIKKNTPVKSSVKASPYATVGKMWRPMSMSASTCEDSDIDETYKTYNNFNALRDMAEELAPSADAKVLPNGHVSPFGKPLASAEGSKVVFTSSTASKTGSSRQVQTSSAASEKSFALLREKVSASHTNSVKQILDTSYTSEDFVQATNDVDRLLKELKQTMESLKSSRIDKKPMQFNMCKDELQTQVRQFVTDAKLLVSNATQTKEKLAVNMNTSMHSLAKIFLHGQATMFMMEAVLQAQHLGSEVMRVANAYKSTLNAAHAAVGKPLSDPHMKYLMRQATSLASLLSTLLKSLKSLEQR